MKISRPMSVLAFLIASTLIAQEAKVTPLMSKDLAELTCKVGFWKGRPKKSATMDRRILPRPQTFEAKLVFVIGERRGNVYGEEYRHNLTDHLPSLLQRPLLAARAMHVYGRKKYEKGCAKL